jgi:hypothetical protein
MASAALVVVLPTPPEPAQMITRLPAMRSARATRGAYARPLELELAHDARREVGDDRDLVGRPSGAAGGR